MTKSKSGTPDAEPQSNYRVSRLVSFILLIGVIAILGVIFYQVMSRFLIPLFLSALLVVIFRPLHEWVLEKVNGRNQVGALLTTLLILLLVLVPVSTLIFMAATEGSAVFKQINTPKIIDDLSSVRSRLNLDMPNSREIRAIENRLGLLQSSMVLDEKDLESHSSSFFEIMGDSINIANANELDWPVEAIEEDAVPPRGLHGYWQRFGNELGLAKQLQVEVEKEIRKKSSDLEDFAASSGDKHEKIHDYIKTIGKANTEFLNFKFELLGGRTRASIVETANPTGEELQHYTSQFIGFIRNKLFALGGSITAFVTSTLFGSVIMIIGLYFFLLDGPALLKSLQGLSPIEDKHEQELVEEFARVSRAVVLATLLSAAVQGLLAGVGFWICGLDSIFLLTLLSAVLAMVPFVGAASVWVPCALYLFFVDNNPYAAIGLAIYGMAVISMADNVIKPWILHGQSNLHPLLALLSVIGGVAVLGPIGILVGPMIVVFLQTLLKILQREMHLMENIKPPVLETTAGSAVPESDDA
ncbi:AI-2E family transporter [Mariniblastus fucicola]|uniref:Putative inner membrane protein n=1 Tax=Mariniblastus fucicola TaxID=980251 RepID=A0A5B9PD17_9BACT|nr:AI-2E family transporter [Mariniblastus fucicola]QEG24258.1 putative inner membrane protein [Mariniblastus fucicola]